MQLITKSFLIAIMAMSVVAAPSTSSEPAPKREVLSRIDTENGALVTYGYATELESKDFTLANTVSALDGTLANTTTPELSSTEQGKCWGLTTPPYDRPEYATGGYRIPKRLCNLLIQNLQSWGNDKLGKREREMCFEVPWGYGSCCTSWDRSLEGVKKVDLAKNAERIYKELADHYDFVGGRVVEGKIGDRCVTQCLLKGMSGAEGGKLCGSMPKPGE